MTPAAPVRGPAVGRGWELVSLSASPSPALVLVVGRARRQTGAEAPFRSRAGSRLGRSLAANGAGSRRYGQLRFGQATSETEGVKKPK